AGGEFPRSAQLPLRRRRRAGGGCGRNELPSVRYSKTLPWVGKPANPVAIRSYQRRLNRCRFESHEQAAFYPPSLGLGKRGGAHAASKAWGAKKRPCHTPASRNYIGGNQRCACPGEPTARYVQIRTTQSPSWVAWSKVELRVGRARFSFLKVGR